MPIVPVTSAFPLLQGIDGSCSAQSVQGDPPDYYTVMARDKARRPTTLRLADVGNQPPPRGWRPVRDSGAALPPDHPYLLRPPCGVLPEDVMRELKQVFAEVEPADLKADREPDKTHLRSPTSALPTLRHPTPAPEPSAPMQRLIGNGLVEDVPYDTDATRQRRLAKITRRIEEKIKYIEGEKERRELAYLKTIRGMDAKIQKLKDKLPPAPPPADPPPAGYVPRR